MQEKIVEIHNKADSLAAEMIQAWKDEVLRVLNEEPAVLMEDMADGKVKDGVLGAMARRAQETLSVAVKLDNMRTSTNDNRFSE